MTGAQWLVKSRSRKGCPDARNFYLPSISFVSLNNKDNERSSCTNLFDVEAAEAAEAQIDAFIDKRSREREEVNQLEVAWAESARRHRHKVRLANGHAWVAYFDHLALCHERRADEFRDRSREVSAMIDALAKEGVAWMPPRTLLSAENPLE